MDAGVVFHTPSSELPTAPAVGSSPVLKPGWRTSEFWLTIAGNAGVFLASEQNAVPSSYAVWFGLGSMIAYTLSRGFVKAGNGAGQ